MLTQMTNAAPVERFRDEMHRLFERFFGEHEPHAVLDPLHLRRYPAVNVWQDDDEVFVEAELPGLTTDDINVTVCGDELTIKGERAALETDEDAIVHRHERGSGSFSRVIHLPVSVDDDTVDAVFDNGVLTITMEKTDDAKSRRIPVKAAETR